MQHRVLIRLTWLEGERMVRMPLAHVVEPGVVVVRRDEETLERTDNVLDQSHKSGECSAFQLHRDVANAKCLVANVLTHHDPAHFFFSTRCQRGSQSVRDRAWQ